LPPKGPQFGQTLQELKDNRLVERGA
jgi:hypothetical protein